MAPCDHTKHWASTDCSGEADPGRPGLAKPSPADGPFEIRLLRRRCVRQSCAPSGGATMPVRQISSRVSAAADMAMRYQRAETDRDRALAKAMSEEVARQPIPCRPRKPAKDLQSDLPTWQSGASTKQEDCVDAADTPGVDGAMSLTRHGQKPSGRAMQMSDWGS